MSEKMDLSRNFCDWSEESIFGNLRAQFPRWSESHSAVVAGIQAADAIARSGGPFFEQLVRDV